MALIDEKTGFPKKKSTVRPYSYHRGGAFPLDDRSLFASFELAQEYLNTNTCYVGQILSVLNESGETNVYTVNASEDGASKVLKLIQGESGSGGSAAINIAGDGDIRVTGTDNKTVNLDSFSGGGFLYNPDTGTFVDMI